MKNKSFVVRMVFALLLNGITLSVANLAYAEDECVGGEQYNFVAKDVEGEEHLMWASCLWDYETNRYEWYFSRENPKARAD